MQYSRMPAAAGAELPLWRSIVGVFVPSLVVFVALDAVWITLIAGKFYKENLSGILKADVDAAAAALSWISIVAINWVFVQPRTVGKGMLNCLAQGALLGLLLYGTVDLTNCALLKDWGWPVALVDMAWGTFACAVLALVQDWLHSWLTKGSTLSCGNSP
jgi:uncharacterized membrane protein